MAVSASTVSAAQDKALDRAVPEKSAVLAGLSVRNGPVRDDDSMDVDAPTTNGKRKSRTSISKPAYKDDSDSDAPFVRRLWAQRKAE